jgi:8-oxo-dGTP pyrophosphatase MutT (NUDIX family)
VSWKTLDSKRIYDSPWITVFEDNVINPKGGRNIYGHVHFKNKAVAIVPLDDEGNTWIVGQDRYTTKEYTWEVPMGGSDPGEEPIDTARRELKEETGLTAATLTPIMRLHTSNSITDEEGFVFVARDLKVGETNFDDMEDLAIRKLPLTEAIDMVVQGEITDAISVAALLRIAVDQQAG